MTYVIEKGIPITPTKNHRNGKYPFGELEIGDSFEVETDKPENVSNVARQWGLRHGRVFATRRTANGVRVWRKA